MKQGFAQLALIVLILLLITSGFAVFFIAKNKTLPPLPTEVSMKEGTPSSAKTSVKDDDPTANWKTYTNSKADYSFKYPENHTVYEGIAEKSPTFIAATPTSVKVNIAEQEEQVFCCEALTLSFSIETTKLSVEKWLEEHLKEWNEEMPKIQKVIFAGKPGAQAFGRGGYGPPYKIIVVQLQASILVISQNSQSSLMDQILSTFKFTD